MMKFSAYRPFGLLLASLLCTAGIAALTGPAVPAEAAASPAGGTSGSPAASLPPAAVATGTGTEADAAPPTDTKGADWDSDDDRDRQDSPDEDADSGDSHEHRHSLAKHRHSMPDHGSQVVNVFGDSVLEAGREVDSVVAVFGNTRVEGTVHDDAVAVFGNNRIDSKIGGDAVAVFGNVELGPHAEVDGDVVAVAGKVRRDPAAIVHGDSNSILAQDFTQADGLRNWFAHCFMYGRPLSLASGLGWAWGLALTLLALHLFIALLFRHGVERCVATFDSQPGRSVLAGLLAVLLTPVLIVLLCITVIGIAAIPFTLIGLFCVALFGKTVILAWLGGRILSVRNMSASGTGLAGTPGSIHPALAVLVGGLFVLAVYLVPFFGFVVFNLLGFLGFGAAVYALIHTLQARHAAKNANGHAAPGTGPATPDTANAANAAHAADDTVPPAAAAATAPGAPGGPAAPPVTSDLPRAGFWIRMGALLLDVLLVGVVSSALWISHVYLVLLAIYGAVMWKLRGCTVGGIVFDLRVVRVDGRAVDWETAIVRGLSCFLSLAVAGLGFFWIAFDAANQAWHDKIAGTVVVRVPKPLARA
jgi:uncharacterized RDD family membrane protein YckC